MPILALGRYWNNLSLDKKKMHYFLYFLKLEMKKKKGKEPLGQVGHDQGTVIAFPIGKLEF